MRELELVKIIWDYMKMNQKLQKSDCIIGQGTEDINVAKTVAKLYFEGLADKIIFTGGLGKITYKLWKETEADKFAKVAIEMGVPKEKIYIENKSTNTGDNFRFSKELIEKERLSVKSCLVVCKPYDEKRSYAAFKKIMPEYDCTICSEEISCEEYYYKNNKEWINVLVGDVQRMKLFYEKGWQIKMDIPDVVWEAYRKLVDLGYTKFVLKDIYDGGDKLDIEKVLNLVEIER